MIVQGFPEFGPTHAEYSQEPTNALERGALLATFEPTDVVAMHLRLCGELLLRKAPAKAEVAKDCANPWLVRVAGHPTFVTRPGWPGLHTIGVLGSPLTASAGRVLGEGNRNIGQTSS